jgi:hypothetical protein
MKTALPEGGNVSLSVTDMQVASGSPKYSIVKDIQTDIKTKPAKLEFGFPVEMGSTFQGEFLNNNGKGELTC